ncbi:MAG: LytTR family transcriptional regulator [Alcanivoracaceae bacterium]|nr:LytTR family transcriptional regulator [Alcanivoracaceae bacterium]
MVKSSSAIYINGKLIGMNGKTSSHLQSEVAGAMDTVFYIDKNIIQKDHNQLVLKMSAQSGFLHLSQPLGHISVGIYSNPTHFLLNHYWISILPFGAFLLAAIYLGVLSTIQKNRKPIIFLSLMSLFAACQLLIEITRGTMAYLYPFHEYRLVLIALFSYAFGICLLAHIIYRFIIRHQIKMIFSLSFISLISVLASDGYDLKAALAVITPSALSLLICIFYTAKKVPNSLSFSLALIFFIVLFFISPSLFLDRYFYYVVAGLLFFLFFQQAIDYSNQRKTHAIEKARADHLQLIINQNKEKANPAKLKVKGAGKIDLIPLDEIFYFKGAGDYVEITMADNKTILHNGSLKELENSLPVIFLKVHRSYIVNTNTIISLKRNSAGTGNLNLLSNMTIPVSRRIMPMVLDSLT